MVRPIACTLCLLMAISLVLAGHSFADECVHGPCCIGPITRPKHNVEKEGKGNMNLGGFSVLSIILAVGQSLRDGSNKTVGTIDKSFEGQDNLIRQIMVGLGASREKAENMRTFGPDAKAYNTFTGDFGSTVSSGLAARNKVSDKARDDLYAYLQEFSNKKSILNRLREAPSGFDFSMNDNLNAQQLAVNKEIVKTIIDPFPALELNENLDQNRDADSYKSTKKAKDARLLIPVAVLSDLMAARAPVTDLAGWSGQVQEKAGGSGSPGRTSANEIISELTNMRFANQDWATGKDGIHSMTETGVLREILMAKVDKLMVEYQKMLWLDRMAALMAQKQLSRNNEFDQVLNHAQANTLQ